MVGVCPEHPRGRLDIKFCMRLAPWQVVLNFKFCQNQLSDFGVVVIEIRPFPLQAIGSAYTTIQASQQAVSLITSGESNFKKAPHGGPIPRLGVTPGGRKLYH